MSENSLKYSVIGNAKLYSNTGKTKIGFCEEQNKIETFRLKFELSHPGCI